MELILHLTERALWEAALVEGAYRGSTRGRSLEEVGFIHLSSPAQLPRVAAALYGDDRQAGELVVLVVDPARLTAPLRQEPGVPGSEETFPHLYGPLPVDAVVAVEPWADWSANGGEAG